VFAADWRANWRAPFDHLRLCCGSRLAESAHNRRLAESWPESPSAPEAAGLLSYRGYVKRLFLLRHAKSARDDPALRDRDRPLAPRGRKAAKRVARWTKKHAVNPQLVVCSSAVRAQQTLQRVRPFLGEPEVWIEVTLYAAGAETLLARIRTLPDEVDEVMLVGHNPGLMDVLLLLAAPGELRERASVNVPAGALAALEADVVRWADVAPGGARLTEFVVPRELE
jgi:phosphohistidine phosphatase